MNHNSHNLYRLFKAIDPNCSHQVENCGQLSSNKNINSIDGTIDIFPQPSAGNFSVKLFSRKDFQQVNFSFVNLTGQVVAHLKTKHLQKGENTFQFDVASLANGIYFLKIENEAFLKTKKFVLQK